MGGDGSTGSINRYTAKDAIGLTLNYFANDYTGINGTPFPGYRGYLDNYRPLYNGNISSMSVYQKRFEDDNFPGGPLIFYNYRYDQLNRLTGQDAYNGFSADSNSWAGMTSMGEYLKERIAYDANGNILKYLRKNIGALTPGAAAYMDSLTYKYYSNTNQLRYIKDSVTSAYASYQDNLITDLKTQPDGNYVYDEIGNLIKDSADEGKTYILDGHNRLKVISQSEKPLNLTVQELSMEEAAKRFPDKVADIKKGSFNKKIKDDK